MSQIGEMHKKIDKVSVDVAHMRGMLDEKLPTLVTKTEVELKIAEHESEKHKVSITPPGGGKKSGKKIGAAVASVITVAATIVYAVFEAIN
jgi:hypothetical protein